MSVINDIATAVETGKAKQIKTLVPQAIEEGFGAKEILSQGLLAGMNVIGDRFTRNEAFVPEVLVSARAMNKGIELIKPLLAEEGNEPIGKCCIGTVAGDLHDIGKNIVRLMLESKNIEVIDLGVDVPPEKFVEAVVNDGVELVCCSALLTTTMPALKDAVAAINAAPFRSQIKVMVGGAPITQEFADEIGADAYTEDAASAAQKAKELVA